MDFLNLRPLPPKTGYHFFEGGRGVGGGWGGGQKFLLNRLKAVGTHGDGNRASRTMVPQPAPDVQASVRILLRILAPAAAAPTRADWGSDRRSHGCRSAALPLGHFLDCGEGPPCCLGPHLPLQKKPKLCVSV